MKKHEYLLKNLECPNCANKIQNKIAENENYYDVNVNFNTLKLTLYSDISENELEKDIKEIIQKIEPDVDVIKFDMEIKNDKPSNENNIKKQLFRLFLGIICILIAIFTENYIQKVFLLTGYAILLYKTALRAIKLLKKKTINENFLITISCIGAYLVGEEFEGVMVILLY